MSAAPKSVDPVAVIGREIAQLKRAREANDDAALADPRRACRFEADNNEIDDRVDALEECISTRRATSLEGVMMQLMVAGSALDIFRAEFDAACRNGECNPFLAGRVERQITRFLYSALSVVEQAAGVSREEFAGDCYMPRSCDPLSVIEAASTAPNRELSERARSILDDCGLPAGGDSPTA